MLLIGKAEVRVEDNNVTILMGSNPGLSLKKKLWNGTDAEAV